MDGALVGGEAEMWQADGVVRWRGQCPFYEGGALGNRDKGVCDGHRSQWAGEHKIRFGNRWRVPFPEQMGSGTRMGS